LGVFYTLHGYRQDESFGGALRAATNRRRLSFPAVCVPQKPSLVAILRQ